MNCTCNCDQLHHEIVFLRSELARRESDTTRMRDLASRLVAGEALTVDELAVLAGDRLAHHTKVFAGVYRAVTA